MISVIISTIDQIQLELVKKNIEKTIGVPYEIINFNNKTGKKGLCEIYNIGAKQAKYEFLCFMHEDVEIKTPNWGSMVIHTFSLDDKIGLIGLAGSTYFPLAPSGCLADVGDFPVVYLNVLQHYKYQNKEAISYYINPKKEIICEVAVTDGVWFCTKKEIAIKYGFDETRFKKFHCYDIDFSLAIRPEFKTVVTFEVLLEHFSEGNYDRVWVEETLKLHRKWKKKLPINLGGLTKADIELSEKRAFRSFLSKMKATQFSKYSMLYMLISSGIFFINPFLCLKLIKEVIFKLKY